MSWFKALGNVFETNTIRGERDRALAENKALQETVAALQAENAALKEEVARMHEEATKTPQRLHYPSLGLQ